MRSNAYLARIYENIHVHTSQVYHLLTSCLHQPNTANYMSLAAPNNKCHHETHSRWHVLMRIDAYHAYLSKILHKNHLHASYVYHLVTPCVDMPSATNYMCIAPLSNKWHQNTFSPDVSCAFTYN